MNRRSGINNRPRSATTNIIPDSPRELETFRQERIRNPLPSLTSNLVDPFDYSFPQTPFLTYLADSDSDSDTNYSYIYTPLGRTILNEAKITQIISPVTRRRALFRNLRVTLDQAEADGTPSVRLEQLLEEGLHRLRESLTYNIPTNHIESTSESFRDILVNSIGVLREFEQSILSIANQLRGCEDRSDPGQISITEISESTMAPRELNLEQIERIVEAYVNAGFSEQEARALVMNREGETSTASVIHAETERLKFDTRDSERQDSRDISKKMIARVAPFWGNSSCNFDEWIIALESAYMDVGWSEEIKINFPYGRLRGTAREFFEEYVKRSPINAKNYVCVRNALHDRFHGRDTRLMYQQELHSIIKNSGETLTDYCDRVKKLFAKSYPLKPNEFLTQAEIERNDKIQMDIYIRGLNPKLKSRLQYKEFDNWQQLI